MKKVLFVVMALLLFGCGGGKETERTVSAVDSTHRVDDLILGYRLGMTRNEARAVTDSLSRAGVLSTYTGRSVEYQGNRYEMHGYPYTYKIGETRIKTIVKPVLKGRRLERLELYVLDRDILNKELEKEYGTENVIPDGYTPEYADNILNFWNRSNQAIYYVRLPSKEAKGGLDILVFEDILKKQASQGLNEESDDQEK